MARTYHHGSKAKQRLFALRFLGGYTAAPTPPKRRRSKQEWDWMVTPSWWIREFHTVPQRARVRALMCKLPVDLEDTPEFPLAKKPHTYYW